MTDDEELRPTIGSLNSARSVPETETKKTEVSENEIDREGDLNVSSNGDHMNVMNWNENERV